MIFNLLLSINLLILAGLNVVMGNMEVALIDAIIAAVNLLIYRYSSRK